MDRTEMRQKLNQMIAELHANGWSQRNIECAFDGMQLEDAYEMAEEQTAEIHRAARISALEA